VSKTKPRQVPIQRSPFTVSSVGLCVSLALGSPASHAQVPKRLSDWLLEQKPSAAAYPLGLSWRVPEELSAQTSLRFGLLKALAGFDKDLKADPRAVDRLREFLSDLPVTGRVPVALADPRWLQANPSRDPVLLAGHSVVLPQRPTTVTVITGEGRRCTIKHVSGHEARAYLRACDPDNAGKVDWTWVAQPDGRVQRYGIAVWNREKQDELAPGAWVWAPARGTWPEEFSSRLIAFLATQGPAPDTAGESMTRAEERAPGASSTAGGASEGLSLSGILTFKTAQESTQPNTQERITLRADTPPVRSRNAEVSSSDWGSVGLLQTPTARMREAGHFTLNFSHIQPYTHGNVFMQPLDWLEAGFRYTNVGNRLYGPAEFSGSQDYKDKSIDVKVRLWSESAYLPQAAVGLRDVAGTGLFSGEYLVANKRTGDFDWSLGMGWGYVGGRANLRNPLGGVFPSFNTRNADVGQGGSFSLKSYFHGPAALFGGVQYQTPWDRLTVKLEYDGNDYQHEPQANNQKRTSPWNFGLVYRAAKSVDLTFGVERGNTLALGLALHTQLDGLSAPKLSDPPRVPVSPLRPQTAADWKNTSRDVVQQTQWDIRSIEQRGKELRVTVDDADAAYWLDRVDRAAAVLHRDAPANVDRFALAYRERGAAMAEHVIDRDAWVAQKTTPVPPSEKRETITARPPVDTEPGNELYAAARPRFEHGLGLNLIHTLGGPDAFVLYQLSAVERAKFWLRDDTWLQGALRLRLYDNYDKFRFAGFSNLPRVRTFMREYFTTSQLTIQNLQLSHVGKLTDNQYYSVYGGYLEDMFGGVGAEWLYRPFGSRFAFGVDVNEVRQRDFHQDFRFRDYQTATGHAALYWDTGWQDVQATVYAGRYLARDMGATLLLSRVFKNGVTVGAFATKTNVSAEQFGEGSFDKGVFVSIPFDAMFTRSTNTNANFVWKPLTRDGGAMLSRSVRLFDVTKVRSDRTLWFEAAPPPKDTIKPEDHPEQWQPKMSPEPYTRVTPKPTSVQWERNALQEGRLADALHRQGYRNVSISYDGSNRLILTLSNDLMRPISLAIGRAARTAARLAPLETRGIRITLNSGATPLATYDFFDVQRLNRYFNGEIKASELAGYVSIEYLNPGIKEQDPLAKLDDLEMEARPLTVSALVPETFSAARIKNDFVGAAHVAKSADWAQAGLVGAGVVLSSSLLDKRAFQFSKDHADSRWLTNGVKVGNALPWIGLAGAAAAAFDGSDPRRSRTGYAATEAGAVAIVAATGLKYAIGRSRPEAGLGTRDFHPFSSDASNSSFPSRHSVLGWAVATPFALEYNAPWLYGIAGLTNLARIGSREHWISDTVASSLIGYGIGRIFWQSSRNPEKGEPRVMLQPNGVAVGWQIQ
jgi:membrane-associated phospholipid phosphatase